MKYLVLGALSSFALTACGANANDSELERDAVGTKRDGLLVATSKLWPSAHIQVCWESASMASEWDEERYWVQDAVYNTWAAVSSVRFHGWGTCSAGQPGVHVHITESGNSSSPIGTGGDGVTDGIDINDFHLGCTYPSPEACVRTAAVHEFGHALGFLHEQNRDDATSGCPKVGTTGGISVGEEDMSSVMHGCNVEWWAGGGFLSEVDVEGVRRFYGGNGWASNPDVFDVDFYMALYPNVPQDPELALFHWLARGLPRLGNRGNRAFAVQDYLNLNGDLKAAYGDPAAPLSAQNSGRYMGATNHWLNIGLPLEGRRGSREFDPRYYRARYGDLDAAFGDYFPAYRAHYDWWGAQVEGRRASADFDVRYYLSLYPDLQNAFGNDYEAALIHWLHFGIGEGRRGAP